MKVLILMLCAACAAACFAQEGQQPLASFTGTVRSIDGGTLTLARQDEDDLEIICTHKTHYFKGSQKIKRQQIRQGDRVVVETKLALDLKPEAVNVRLLPPKKDTQQ